MLTSLVLLGAVASYRIVDLGTPAVKENVKVEAVAINNRGEVLVKADGASLWRNGRFLDFGKAAHEGIGEGTVVEPRGLNDFGIAVGGSGSYSPVFMSGLEEKEPFVWRGRKMELLVEDAGVGDEAFDINDRGEIVGGDGIRAFVRVAGKIRRLPTLSHAAAGNRAEGVAINDRRTILGTSTYGGGTRANSDLSSRPFLADVRTLKPRPVPLPRGYTDGRGLDLNDRGSVLASAEGRGQNPVMYLVRSGRTTLLKGPKFTAVLDGRLNGRSEAVATVFLKGVSTPLLWTGGRPVPFPRFPGWTLLKVTGINDRGAICGTGIHNGKTRAYVLTPR